VVIGHLVAFGQNLTYLVNKAAVPQELQHQGESQVIEFFGPGKLRLQSRNPGSLLSWLAASILEQASDGKERHLHL
jgi:uncharacterized protein (AIM24 family)